jgi:hypothetical protein
LILRRSEHLVDSALTKNIWTGGQNESGDQESNGYGECCSIPFGVGGIISAGGGARASDQSDLG